jgi:hypothetical protein
MQEMYLELINKIDKTEKEAEYWESKLIQVDIKPPKDIFIAFLMSRNRNRRNIQDLNDKQGEWYTGPEIVESILIGYRVTKIYAYYQFKYYREIFNDFIMRNWLKKAKAGRDTAPYMTSKMNMNALSGKYGQKSQDLSVKIMVGSDIKKDYLKDPNTQIIWNHAEDEIVGLVVKVKEERHYSSYAIQNSSFILGNSKVSMSTYTRKINGYHDPNAVPKYGDTDSLIVHNTATKNAPPEEYGKELGQMKDEYPDSRIFAIVVLAPKMYMKLFIEKSKKRNRYEILCNFTAKGIVHIKHSYEAFKDYTVPPLVREHALELFHFLESRKDLDGGIASNRWKGPVYLKTPYYITTIQKKDNPIEYQVKDRITWEDVTGILRRDREVHVLYGTISRMLKAEFDYEKVGVCIDYNKREVSSDLWWDKGSRLFDIDGSIHNPISYPLGHTKEKDCKDLSYLDIII